MTKHSAFCNSTRPQTILLASLLQAPLMPSRAQTVIVSSKKERNEQDCICHRQYRCEPPSTYLGAYPTSFCALCNLIQRIQKWTLVRIFDTQTPTTIFQGGRGGLFVTFHRHCCRYRRRPRCHRRLFHCFFLISPDSCRNIPSVRVYRPYDNIIPITANADSFDSPRTLDGLNRA